MPIPGIIRAPLFAGAAQAAETLRRLPAYRQAQTMAITAEPVLLQVRINALMDGKILLAATPGLKDGLVRLTGRHVPMSRRHLDLRGQALFKVGKPLPLPQTRLGRVDLLVSTALAVDQKGMTLGDGRGVLDIFSALLTELQALPPAAPVIILAHEAQLLEKLPAEAWDTQANLIITPKTRMTFPSSPRPGLCPGWLAQAQRRLPLIKAWLGATGAQTAAAKPELNGVT